MTKKDILNKIKNAILGEGSTTPGITVTNKTQKSEKKFNDDYYKESNKKFKDYLGIKKDDFDAPKVNADEEQEKSYGGSGMEGLTYDNEGTEVAKKFTKRVDDLNKPSKDYYLKKDEVNDVFSKLKKKSKSYQDEKEIYQNTPPVRAVEAKKLKSESTIKRLTYKTEFVNENIAFNLIPEDFKKNNLVFEMTDGNRLMKIRWEGNKNGRPIVLLSKDTKKISQELEKMHHLFEYNSRENLTKTNLLTEDQEFRMMIGKVKSVNEVESQPDTSTSAKEIEKSVEDPTQGKSPLKINDASKSTAMLPGVNASYDKKSYDWSIIIDKEAKNRPDVKLNVASAVESIIEANQNIKRIKTDLNRYLNINKNVLGDNAQYMKDKFGLS